MKENKFSWDNIPIKKYYEILDILEDKDMDDLSKNVSLLSCITGEEEDIFWEMNMSEISVYLEKLTFLNKFQLVIPPKKINISGWELDVCQDPTNLSVSQFFDYQQFIKKQLRESISNILSVFLIPKQHKYNDGYDIRKLQKDLNENLSYLTAQSLLSFFLSRSILSMRHSLTYLGMKTKTPEKEKIKELKNKIQGICSFGSPL